jgi:uncharacterized protein YecE (DUF72 family)
MAEIETDTASERGPGTEERLIRVGTAGLPSGIARHVYFENLDLLEVDVTFFEPPRDVALRRWRQEAPEGTGFAMLAWQAITHEADTPGYARMTHKLSPEAKTQVGSFRATPPVNEAWQRTLAAARALGAEVILFQTPPTFTPTEANRNAMRRFFGEIAADHQGMALAWEPRGIWEPAQAATLAAELGLVYALDPLQLEVPPPDEPQAYFRVHGLGIYRNKISDDMLEILADMAWGYERAWVVFANVEKYRDAERFHKLCAGREFVEDDLE